MHAQGIDDASESFKDELSLLKEEIDYIQLMHHLWFVKILEANQTQMRMSLDIYRAEI